MPLRALAASSDKNAICSAAAAYTRNSKHKDQKRDRLLRQMQPPITHKGTEGARIGVQVASRRGRVDILRCRACDDGCSSDVATDDGCFRVGGGFACPG